MHSAPHLAPATRLSAPHGRSSLGSPPNWVACHGLSYRTQGQAGLEWVRGGLGLPGGPSKPPLPCLHKMAPISGVWPRPQSALRW